MFKTDFKHYKSKKPPPDLKDVLDFDRIKESGTSKVKVAEASKTKSRIFGLTPPERWKIYEITSNPGLIFVRNPFTCLGQRYWCARSVRDYARKQSKTNLDVHDLVPEGENWWQFCHYEGNEKLLDKLRWATLGYHHNWDTKVYSEELKDEFPSDLSALCKFIATAIGCDSFKPEAAIVNYYHLDSTLSGHTDHSEQNLEAPLFSFSFGQTAVFLLGGETIDVRPTALFLRSGDVIVMGKESRLAYHGIPKILRCTGEPWEGNLDDLEQKLANVERTLEDADQKLENADQEVENAEQELENAEQELENAGQKLRRSDQKLESEEFENDVISICRGEVSWKPFGDYMKSSRININVRQVLRRGDTSLPNL